MCVSSHLQHFLLKLNQASKVCQSTFESVDTYEHSKTEHWNTNIIVSTHNPSPQSKPRSHTATDLQKPQQSILQSLISETSTPESPPAYKYAVNSTIIQHQPPSTPTTSSSSSTKPLSPPPTTTTSTSTTTANEASTADDTHPVAGGADDERTRPSPEAAVTNPNPSPSLSPSSGVGGAARRGMHSATGAYWNTERDGMWSYKYEGGEARGFDVVICVLWMAV